MLILLDMLIVGRIREILDGSSFCEAWQDSRGFALLFSKDRPEAGEENSGSAEAPESQEETANGSRRVAESRQKPLPRTYAMLSYK